MQFGMIGRGVSLALAVAFNTLFAQPASAAIWQIFIDISALSGERTSGLLPKQFVSQRQCEVAAQGVLDEFVALRFIIHKVECRRS